MWVRLTIIIAFCQQLSKACFQQGLMVSAAAAAQNDTTGNVASDQKKATPCDPIYISLFAIKAWHVQLHTVMQQ